MPATRVCNFLCDVVVNLGWGRGVQMSVGVVESTIYNLALTNLKTVLTLRNVKQSVKKCAKHVLINETLCGEVFARS